MNYEASLKHRRDVEAVHNSTRRAGIAEGKKEGLLEAAWKMKKSGFEDKTIADITGLSIEEIKEL